MDCGRPVDAGGPCPRRAELAFDWNERRGRNVKTLLAPRSSGPRTSRAVTLLADLGREIQDLSDDELNLDDLVQRLMLLRRVDRHQLQAEFEALAGKPSRVLQEAPFG
jgi:hypothetical protein